jgi:hypothetical protein
MASLSEPDSPRTSAAPTFVVERKALPPDETHKCRLPGFFRRRRLGLRQGAIVRCSECGTRYEWRYESGLDTHWWEWSPIATGGRCDD